MGIELKNIYFKYDRSLPLVLNDVSLKAENGKITLLSGLSGSGKSTILSLISGIIPNVYKGLIKGDILINGNSILNKKLNEITKEVGVVLQNADNQIIHNLVEDEIAFGCENIGLAPSKIEEEIEKVTTLMELDRNWQTRKLSGGQKERLITSSILAMGQKILILDEPLANLDREGSIKLLNILKKLASENYAILIVEHRLDMVFNYVDEIYHIESGTLKKISNKEEYLGSQILKIENEFESKLGPKLIELKNIGYESNKRKILKDINLDIYEGEKLVILGDNGCGKTTLSKIISKIIKPSFGTYIENLDPKIKKANKKWFEMVGVIYQNPNYQLFMPTVKEEIKFSCKNDEIFNEVVTLFKLESLLNRHPQSLSEGEKRKLTVALILASLPKLIILDEPTVGQDYNSLKNMVHIVNYFHHKYHNTMITITHDIRCVEALADRVVLIEDGVIKKSGKKEVIDEFFNKKIN